MTLSRRSMLAAVAVTVCGSGVTQISRPALTWSSGPTTVTAPRVLGARCVVAHRGRSIELGPGQSVTLPA